MRSSFDEEIDRKTRLISPTRVCSLGKRGLQRLLIEIAVDAALGTLIEDWDGVEIDGKPIPFKDARPALIADGLLRACIIAAAARVDSDQAPGEIAQGLA
jgi:hypothetical protein